MFGRSPLVELIFSRESTYRMGVNALELFATLKINSISIPLVRTQSMLLTSSLCLGLAERAQVAQRAHATRGLISHLIRWHRH